MSQYFENDKNVKSDIRLLTFKFGNYNFNFYSDNGVFSKNEIDYGSKFLIECFLKENRCGKVLDVGGGIGVISIIISKILGNTCDMVEINERAIELSNKNISLNHLEDKVKTIKSDVYEKVTSKYDFVITNPPIRAGKKVIYDILLGAYERLNENGELWFVMRKNHGGLSAQKDVGKVFGNCEIIDRDKGFYIFRAIKGNTTI